MDYLTDLPFNPKSPTLMHIDLNSCFATVEQQANPLLRGKPIAVAAYKTDSGCILAPSIEAKRYGIHVGMRVKEAKMLFPDIIILEPDPWKYRNVHLALKKVLSTYTEKITPKSIDEFVLDLEGYPALKKGISNVAVEIKRRIKSEIGEWLTVSIGISTNRYLAKIGAGLTKPDGLDVIDIHSYEDIFSKLALTDLCGIKTNNAIRLNKMGIYSVTEFAQSSAKKLQRAFHSVVGYYWYLRLRGWEIDDVEFGRHSYGNSTSLAKPLTKFEELSPVLMKLVEKMSQRMRNAGYRARGVHISMLYRNGTHWHKGFTLDDYVFSPGDIYRYAYKIMCRSPYQLPVHTLAVSCFEIAKQSHLQLSMLEELSKKENLVKALDNINERWGDFVITPAQMLNTKSIVKDRIAFGGVKELEEFIMT